MSLINQMLRDLEARRAAERRQQEGGIFAGLSQGAAAAQGPRRLLGLLGVVIAALMMLIAYLAWQRYAQPQPVAATPLTATPAIKAAEAPPPAPAPVIETPTSAASPAAPATPAPTTSTPVQHVVTAPQPAPVSAQHAAHPAPAADNTPAEPEPLSGGLIEKRPRPLSLAEQAERAYQLGLKALREGKHTAAEAALREALAIDQEHLQARETLAAMLLSTGRRIEAGEVLEAGRRFFARNPTLALLMARIQVEEGNLSAAITTLEQGLYNAGSRSDYLAFLAALYQRALRFDDSIAAYQRALAIEPGQGSWRAGLAISLENLGRRQEALKTYQQANITGLPPQLAGYVQERIRALSND